MREEKQQRMNRAEVGERSFCAMSRAAGKAGRVGRGLKIKVKRIKYSISEEGEKVKIYIKNCEGEHGDDLIL